MASAPSPRLTPAEYLALDRAAAFRSEFFDGQMYAMSGASLPHSQINANVLAHLYAQLGDGPCQPLASDLRVALGAGEYAYPDILIVCGPPQLIDDDFDILVNPLVILEILSSSTQKWDRGGRFAGYQRIASLRHSVLISQDAPSVERFDRRDHNTWLATTISAVDGVLIIEPMGIRLTLRDIYRRVFEIATPA